MPTRYPKLTRPDAGLRRLSRAVAPWPALAAEPPGLADSPPGHGSEDEIWMVSYMDIMTLLLAFFVLLFVYTRAVGPAVAAATSAPADPPHLTAPRNPGKAGPAVEQPAVAPAADFVAPLELPIPDFAMRLGDASVTHPTLTVPVDAEPEGSSTPAAEGAVENVGQEHPTSPPEPSDSLQPAAVPPGGAAAVVADVPTDGTEGEPADATPGSPESLAPPPQRAAEPPADMPALTPTEPAATPDPALLAAIQASELGRRVEVSVRKDAVNLEISDEILFHRGSAGLTPSGETLLAELAKLLAQQAVRISVEGHTDDSPIRSARFASNWELSAARATNVTHALIARAVDPARVRAVGYADTRPRADNASEQGRARNRRVALVLHLPAGAESAW